MIVLTIIRNLGGTIGGVALIAFIYFLWKMRSAHKSAGDNYLSDDQYNKYKKLRNMAGIVFLVGGIIASVIPLSPEEKAEREQKRIERELKREDKSAQALSKNNVEASCLVTSKDFMKGYNAALDWMGEKQNKDYSTYKITKTKDADKGMTYITKSDLVLISSLISEKDKHITGIVMTVMRGNPQPPFHIITNAAFLGALNRDFAKSMTIKSVADVLAPLQKGQTSNFVHDNGVVIGYLADDKGIAFTIMLEETFQQYQGK